MKKPINFAAGVSKRFFILAIVAGATISFAGTAHADNDWNGHERGAQRWHRQHIRHGRYVQPERYVQQDPYVVYAPPVVVEPPSGINVIIPLHIR